MGRLRVAAQYIASAPELRMVDQPQIALQVPAQAEEVEIGPPAPPLMAKGYDEVLQEDAERVDRLRFAVKHFDHQGSLLGPP